MDRGIALDSAVWAAWAGVVVTTLTFTIALALFVIGLRDRRRAFEDRERDQARKVWIWVGEPPFNPFPTYSDDQSKKSAGWYIINASKEPISACRVGLASTPTQEIAKSEPQVIVLGPEQSLSGGTLSYPAPPALPDDAPQADMAFPSVQLIFMDAAGVQWRRDSLGNLDVWQRPQRNVMKRR